MSRRHDWPQRLDDYLAARQAEPFVYGTHDCCQFAAQAVEAMTGENPAAAWQYTNEIGAARLIHEAGGMAALVSQALPETIHPSRAGRGDVVFAELENGPTVGICVGRECVFAAEVGFVFRPRSVIHTAWRVS